MILATRSGDREVRSAALGDLVPSPGSGAGYAGVPVTQNGMHGLPAVDAALQIAGQAVARRHLRVWSGEGYNRRQVTASWQARLLAAAAPHPAQSWFEFWETVERSMTARRNAYIWRDLDRSGRVAQMLALHPDQVHVSVGRSGQVVYQVWTGSGYIDPTGRGRAETVQVTSDNVMHIKGPGGGGLLVAPSPVEVHRTTFGAQIAQQRYAEGFYRRGTGAGLVLSFPYEVTGEQALEAKEMWEASDGGVDNAHGTRVVSGGATVTPVTISQRDAQFLEAMAYGVDEVARILNVTPSLIGGGMGVGQRGGPMSPEHEKTRWNDYGLQPRLRRLEDAFRTDPLMFGGAASTYPAFTDADPVRGDRATEDAIIHAKVQDGRMLVDEARAIDGLAPLPGGVGSIPQIVPVGGSPHGVADPTATT